MGSKDQSRLKMASLQSDRDELQQPTKAVGTVIHLMHTSSCCRCSCMIRATLISADDLNACRAAPTQDDGSTEVSEAAG